MGAAPQRAEARDIWRHMGRASSTKQLSEAASAAGQRK